ncbi:metal-dependent transcriptional regulator [bacterium]|nr:metal-dependent transcriptional regulator [bacterium]
MDKSLTAVLEDYMEVIFNLIEDNYVARVKEIADRMNVKMPTVTSTLKKLSKMNLINYDPYSVVTLTPKGRKAAKQIIFKHETLMNFFHNILLVPKNTAYENACKFEHSVDNILLEKLELFTNFINEQNSLFIKNFEKYCNGQS